MTRGRPSPPVPLCAMSLVIVLLVCSTPAGSGAAGALFVESAVETGLAFTHVNGAMGHYYLAEEMGAGVALFDFDNDGDLDVLFVQGRRLGDSGGPGSDSTALRLFRNDLMVGPDGGRTLRFTDVTERAGLHLRGYGLGVAVADYDNDGWQDVYVTAFGTNALYRNMGDGTFADVTAIAGVDDGRWNTSAAFVDFDRDGHLDLYVAGYVDFTLAGNRLCYDSVGARDYCSPSVYRPIPDRLFRNLGGGRFADVTESAGIGAAAGAGLGVAIGDYDGDGWLDVYVANDATPNQLWMNQGDGTFRDEGLISGAAISAAGRPEASMGIASGDFDLDGDEDLFVTNLVGETFVLYVNDGRGSFEDARTQWGLAAPTAAFTGFGTEWLDYDNDGLLDLFVTNGAVNLVESQRGQPRPFRMADQLFRQLATGRFEEVSAAAGAVFARKEVGRGAAFGDLDNDGDIDIIVTNNGGPAMLLLNQSASSHHWLQLRLEQEPRNTFGLGAWVGVERQGAPTLWRRVRTDGSYLSASDVRIHVGLGAAASVAAVVVRWPDGQQERWSGVKVDRLVTLRRGTGDAP
jgi:enediyne biosynthesis protein E4